MVWLRLMAALALAAALAWGPVWSRLAPALRSVSAALCCVPWLTGFGMALGVPGIRVLLLPWWPIPRPYIYDEFSYLLQADTFAHGRLTNPVHPLWQFFETIYVLVKPSYASKYPPGQAIAMAAGQVMFGHPWFGVALSAGCLVWALWWAAGGWLPRRWALCATALALPLCFSTYWMNSYWGGAVTAVGGALATGGLGRLRTGGRHASWAVGVGFGILILTRPFEGLLLAASVAWFLPRRILVWPPIIACVLATLGWTAYDNQRVTGNPLQLPYQEYWSQYESVPAFTISTLAPAKTYRHFDLEFLAKGWEAEAWSKAHSWRLLLERPGDWYSGLSVITGSAFWLFLLIGLLPAMARTTSTRPLAVALAVLLSGSFLEVHWYAHYAAPFTAVLFIMIAQSLRYTQAWRGAGGVTGYRLARALPLAFLAVTAAAEARQILRHNTPDQMVPRNARRGEVEARLAAEHPGKHVIFVRYTGAASPRAEWIYNTADIDGQTVIWAQDMDDANQSLMRYYPGRRFWLFKPDEGLDQITPLR